MAENGPGQVEVRPVSAAETRHLRLAVLRPGRPAKSALYVGDDDVAAAHFGAFASGALVGVASIYDEARSDGPSPGWRLRGMATAPDQRRRGAGQALLAACVDHATVHGGAELWCNARTSARGFYERAGFEVVSDQFDIAGIGPHVVMRLLL